MFFSLIHSFKKFGFSAARSAHSIFRRPGITEVPVVCMANDICTSFNGLPHHIIKVAIDYIKMILCASKLHVFNFVLIFCPDSTDVAKYNYVMMNTL